MSYKSQRAVRNHNSPSPLATRRGCPWRQWGWVGWEASSLLVTVRVGSLMGSEKSCCRPNPSSRGRTTAHADHPEYNSAADVHPPRLTRSSCRVAAASCERHCSLIEGVGNLANTGCQVPGSDWTWSICGMLYAIKSANHSPPLPLKEGEMDENCGLIYTPRSPSLACRWRIPCPPLVAVRLFCCLRFFAAPRGNPYDANKFFSRDEYAFWPFPR